MPAHRSCITAWFLALAWALALTACGGGGGSAQEPVADDGTARVTSLAFAQTMSRASSDAGQRLTPGRPVLVRAVITADQPGVPSPAVFLQVSLNAQSLELLPMAGPAALPLRDDVNDLSSTFNALVPAAWVQPGVTFTVFTGAATNGNSLRVQPEVGLATRLHLVVVPLSVNGTTGNVPDLAAIHRVLSRAFPFAATDIVVTQRAALVVEGLDGLRNNEDTLSALAQLEAARTQEDPAALYYGFFSASAAAADLGGIGAIGTVGNEALSAASALGLDATYQFQRVDPLDLRLPAWARTLVHELGHTHGLWHAPCGGATQVDSSYPYAGAELAPTMPVYDSAEDAPSLGRLGATRTAAGAMTDVMSYCDGVFFSDYFYNRVQRYAEARAAAWPLRSSAMAAATATAAPTMATASHLLLSGRISAAGVSFNPVRPATAAPPSGAPTDGAVTLRLSLANGSVQSYPVVINDVADGASGMQLFALTVPNPGPVSAAVLLRSQQVMPLATGGGLVSR